MDSADNGPFGAVPGGTAQYRFDVASGTLWQGSRRVLVRARTAAVLRHLLERRGDVVSREELRQVVWGGRHGGESGPKQCVRELRSLFADSPTSARYIETVGQSGYRLIGDIELVASADQSRDDEAPDRFVAGQPLCVGRERELQEMDTALAAARRGERPLLLIAGEPGIGKTTLIDAFIGRLHGRRDLWVARGPCLPHDGPGEAYGPLLSVVEQLASGRMRTLVIDLVRHLAPRLLTQLPTLFERREILEKQVEIAGGGPEQALRQLIHVFGQLGRQLPGVVVIEDAHWADSGSCNWISAWALQRMPTQLLLIVSYRPGSATGAGHPVRQMLAEARRAPGCRAIELAGLTTEAVAHYLDIRFPDNGFSAELAPVLQERTEGHALFVTGMVQDWLARGLLARRQGPWGLTGSPEALSAAVPTDIHALIDRQLLQLTEIDRRLLELASAAGAEFSAAALAGAADSIDDVERQCEALVERQLLLRRPEPVRWPDGTEATGYGFRHGLYRRAIYGSVPANVRAKLHLRIGARLEKSYGKQRDDMAATLGEHFALGGDDRRAALYHRLAGETALLRGAAREAQEWFRRALAHIARWPAGPARNDEEIQAQLKLAVAHVQVDGFGAPTVAAAFERALVLARRISDYRILIPALKGIYNYRSVTGDWQAVKRLATRIHRLAQAKGASLYAIEGDNAVGYVQWKLGNYRAALPHIERAAAAYRQQRHAPLSIVLGEDPGVASRYSGAIACVLAGDVDAADRHLAAGMAVATAIKQPFAAAEMLWAHCVVAHERGDAGQVERWALALHTASLQVGIDSWQRPARAVGGWAAAARGDAAGVDQMSAVLQTWRELGFRESVHYMLALYAEACLRHGRLAAAEAAIAEALTLVRDTGECWYEAGVLCLRGQLAQRLADGSAAARFRQAARVARRQGARLLELRAQLGLAEDYAAKGDHAAAGRALRPLRPFIERARDLPDARMAQAVLAR